MRAAAAAGTGRIVAVMARCDGADGLALAVRSGESTVDIGVRFALDPALPAPTVGFGMENAAGMAITSASTRDDGVTVARDAAGMGEVWLRLPALPLLKGDYRVAVFLACERAVHVYDWVPNAVTLAVSQQDLTQGVVSLPRSWSQGAPEAAEAPAVTGGG